MPLNVSSNLIETASTSPREAPWITRIKELVRRQLLSVEHVMRLKGLIALYDVESNSISLHEEVNADCLRKLTVDETFIAFYFLGKRIETLIHILKLVEIGVCKEKIAELWPSPEVQ